MDDDDFRRSHPTCHKVDGEAIALLAGVALSPLAFELLWESNSGTGYSHDSIDRKRKINTTHSHPQGIGLKPDQSPLSQVIDGDALRPATATTEQLP